MGLPAFATVKTDRAGFYSTQDTRIPVRVAVFTLLVNVLLNVIFLFYFFPNSGTAAALPARWPAISTCWCYLWFSVCGRDGSGHGTFWIHGKDRYLFLRRWALYAGRCCGILISI